MHLALKKVLLGLGVGDKKSALLKPEESFGERKEDLVQWVSLKALKEGRDDDVEFNPGDVIEFNAPGGAQYAGVLQSIDEEKRVHGLISIIHLPVAK